MQTSFSRSWREPISLKAHASVCKPRMKIFAVSGLSRYGCPRGIEKFLGGTSDYLIGLRNFWTEQLSCDELCSFLEEYYQEVLWNSRAHLGVQIGLHNLYREGWFPYRIAQFLARATKPKTDSESKKKPVKGVEQIACIGWQESMKELKLMCLTV